MNTTGIPRGGRKLPSLRQIKEKKEKNMAKKISKQIKEKKKKKEKCTNSKLPIVYRGREQVGRECAHSSVPG